MKRRILGLGLCAAVALGAWGCSSSSSDDGGSEDGGTTPPAAEPDPRADWTCLGAVKLAAVQSGPLACELTLTDPAANKPVKAVTVKSCAKADRDCASPLETVTTDEAGYGKLAALPAGFDGFLELKAGADLTNLVFFAHPQNESSTQARWYWSSAELGLVLSAGSITRDPARGSIGIQAHDCAEMPGGVPCYGKADCTSYIPGGVTFEIDVKDPAIVAGYVVVSAAGTAVSTTATATSPFIGLGGFFNVPPGPVTVTAKVAATGKTIGTYAVHARAGALTHFSAAPN